MRTDQELRRIGATLRLDAVASELVGELGAAGVRTLVFRGPATKAALYADHAYRAYDDIDLLVAPSSLETARGLLRAHGFAPAVDSDRSQPWVRSDGVTIDLHTTIVGIGSPPGEAWAELSDDTRTFRLAQGDVEMPGPVALAVVVALHAAQHGRRAGKAIADLERALTTLPIDVWTAAAQKAARLDAAPAFGAGLRLVPSGEDLAATLGLSDVLSEEVALRAASAPPTALGLQRFAEAEGFREKIRLMGTELAPTPAFMRSMYPLARRGRLGLSAAYALRPFRLLRQLGPAMVARRRARRAVR